MNCQTVPPDAGPPAVQSRRLDGPRIPLLALTIPRPPNGKDVLVLLLHAIHLGEGFETVRHVGCWERMYEQSHVRSRNSHGPRTALGQKRRGHCRRPCEITMLPDSERGSLT